MSLFGDYIYEREGKNIIEDQESFATYKIHGTECYIEDVYVQKEARKNVKAHKIVDRIAEIAKAKGVQFLTTTVSTIVGNPTASVRAILGYGFRVHSAKENLIVFIKEV